MTDVASKKKLFELIQIKYSLISSLGKCAEHSQGYAGAQVQSERVIILLFDRSALILQYFLRNIYVMHCQILEVLVQKCLSCADEYTTNPGRAVRTIFESIASGILLQGISAVAFHQWNCRKS